MRTFHIAAGIALVAAMGCSGDAAKAKADSVAAIDTAAVQDSIRGAVQHINDSLAAAAGNAALNAPPAVAPANGMTGETHRLNDPATSGKIIGRDSAFGPVGMMDSHGRITKIKR